MQRFKAAFALYIYSIYKFQDIMANKITILRIGVLLSLILLSLSIFAQTSNITQGCAPLEVEFQGPGGLSAYFWDFDDRSTSSNLQNPEHNFINPGTYTVTLFEGEGGTQIGTLTIEVFSKPDLDFVGDPAIGCAPLQVNFTDITDYTAPIQVTSRTWTFGDGGNNNGVSPTYIYNDQGEYTVGLSISTNFPSCDTTIVKTDYIEVGEELNVDFNINPGSFSCDAPFTVSFENTSETGTGITYSWDFDNGQTSDEFTPGNVTYTEPGSYDVRLTVTSEDAGCSNFRTRTINISQPGLQNTVRDTMCFDGPNLISSLVSNAQYEWDFGPDAIPQTSTNQSNNVTFTRTGFHDIYFKITSLGGSCSSDTMMRVYVEDVDVSFTRDPLHLCEFPSSYTYRANQENGRRYAWTFDNLDFLTGREIMHEKQMPDTSYYHQIGPFYSSGLLFVTSSAGCVADTAWVDTLLAPFAVLLVDDDDGCAPLDVEFDYFTQSLENIVSYTLHFGDGQMQNFASPVPITHQYTDPGEYEAFLVIENTAGCIDTSVSILIEVGSNLSIDFTADRTEICLGEDITLSETSNDPNIDGWYWSYGDERSENICYNDNSVLQEFDFTTGPTDVTLRVEYNGCFTEVTKEDYIDIKGAKADFEYVISCDSQRVITITNTTQNADSFTWNFGNDPEYQNPMFSYEFPTTGDFIIGLVARSADCPDNIKFEEVFIREPEANLEVYDSRFTLQPEPLRLCGGEEYIFSGSNSTDVVMACGKGYTWEFSESSGLRTRKTGSPNILQGIPTDGFHSLILEVVDVNGCTDRDTVEFRPYSQDVNFAISDTSICLPSSIDFTSFSTGDTSIVLYEFFTGDNGYYTDSFVSHDYLDGFADSSLITVTHIATDALGCKDTLDREITVYEPKSEISVTRSRKICVEDIVTVSATDFTSEGSFLNYQWNILDSVGTMSDSASFDVSFPDEGIYEVILTIEEDATGCTNEIRETIEVQAYPQAGYFTNQDTSSVYCNPATIIFTDTTISNHFLSYDWYINGELESEIANPGFTFEKGIYEVQLVAKTLNGCFDTTDLRVFEVIGPEGEIILDSALICKGESVEFAFTDTVDVSRFEWDFGDGVIVENENPVIHQYDFNPSSGRTTATLTLFGPSGVCTAIRDVPIRIHEVVADFTRNDGIDTALCLGDYPFYSTSTNADNLTWDFGDGTIGQGDSVIHTYPDSGYYVVTLSVTSDSLSCVDTISKEILIYPLPVPGGIGDTICLGDTAQIFVDNPSVNSFYDWVIDSSVISNTGFSLSAIPQMTRTYELIEEDSLGCEGSAPVQVDVILPIPPFAWDTSIVIGDTAFLPVPQDQFLSFDWTPMTGLSCYDCPNPYIQIFNDEMYTLSITDVLNCFETRYTYNIEVIEEEKLRIPDLFTPDGNSVNDIIYLEGWAIKELRYFRIFNRWGEKVFETDDLDIGWDGYHKGKQQPPGVYFYQVEAISWKDDNVLVGEGEFELVR